MVSDEFADLVAKDVRNECSNHELEILADDLNGWLTELKSLKRDVEIQLSAQKARMYERQAEMLRDERPTSEWLSYKATEEKWKVGAMRFTACVEQRIAHVNSLKAQQNLKTMVA